MGDDGNQNYQLCHQHLIGGTNTLIRHQHRCSAFYMILSIKSY